MIDKIDHIAIAVEDVSAAASFFKKAFGIETSHTEDVPQQGVRIAFINVGGVHIELIQPLDESSRLNNFLSKRGAGLHHIAFAVSDLEKSLSALKKSGVRLIDEEPRKGAGNKKIAFVYPSKTTGLLIELCEK